MSEVQVQEIHYFRQVRPPTLKQYLLRRAVREEMAKVKGQVGITVNPATGLLIPASALAAKEALKGLNADLILEEHPEWRNDYEKDISTQR